MTSSIALHACQAPINWKFAQSVRVQHYSLGLAGAIIWLISGLMAGGVASTLRIRIHSFDSPNWQLAVRQLICDFWWILIKTLVRREAGQTVREERFPAVKKMWLRFQNWDPYRGSRDVAIFHASLLQFISCATWPGTHGFCIWNLWQIGRMPLGGRVFLDLWPGKWDRSW